MEIETRPVYLDYVPIKAGELTIIHLDKKFSDEGVEVHRLYDGRCYITAVLEMYSWSLAKAKERLALFNQAVQEAMKISEIPLEKPGGSDTQGNDAGHNIESLELD